MMTIEMQNERDLEIETRKLDQALDELYKRYERLKKIKAWNDIVSALDIWYNHPLRDDLLVCYFYGQRFPCGKMPKIYRPPIILVENKLDAVDFMMYIKAIELGNDSNFIDPSPSY